MKLNIATNFSLPEDAVTSTLLVYGGKGMGKSNCGTVILEEMSRAGLKWSAIDPAGVLFGIRYSSDGKNPGVKCLILGGPHGDIPLEPTGGAIVADLVADNDVNVIIDISRKPNGEMWSIGERIRFVSDYGKRLFARQGSLIDGKRREPMFQLIDEAARFMPQMIRANEPQLAMCLGTWAAIVEEGRNIGLGVGILTQRSARVSKDVAELADLMLAFRTVGPNSIAAIMDWLGEHVPKSQVNDMIGTIRSLPVGSALAVSPGWLKHEGVVEIRKRHTFDSSATPKPGERKRKVSGAGARPDLAKYAELMKETVERAKADDPKALRQKIALLEAELAKAGKHPAQIVKPLTLKPNLDDITNIIREQLETASRALLESGISLASRIEQRAADFSIQVAAICNDLRRPDSWTIPLSQSAAKRLAKTVGMVESSAPSRQPQAAHAARSDADARSHVQPRPSAPKANSGPSGDGFNDLNGPERRILSAMAQLRDVGLHPCPRVQVALLADYSNQASTGFAKGISFLSSKGLISYPSSGMVAFTPDGEKIAPDTDPLQSNRDLHERLFRLMPGPETRLLRVLIEENGETITRESLAERSGYGNTASTGFAKAISRLSSLGLIEYPCRGQVRARDVLFPMAT